MIIADGYRVNSKKVTNNVLSIQIETEFHKRIGNQYKISADNQDFYIDLLFYHLELRCYVVVELKASLPMFL